MDNRDRFISGNIGLVHSCARRFLGRGIEYEDMLQAGCVGLVKAFDGFDRERGVKFSTYAVPVILGEIRRLFREGGTVKVGRTLKELSLRAVRERERFLAREGREPRLSELAEILQVERETATEALCAAMPALSLTAGEEDGGGQTDIPVAPPEEKISDILALRQELSHLEPRDKKLILLRFYKSLTQTQTAKILGMTQVQVSRRERAIIVRLRRELIG